MPYSQLRQILQAWSNSAFTDARLAAILDRDYHAEEIAYSYQLLKNTIAADDTSNVDISTRKSDLETLVNDQVIKVSREATDERNRQAKAAWDDNYFNTTFKNCNNTVNSTEINRYNFAISQELTAKHNAEAAFNLTLGYGNTTAVANRTSMALDLLSAQDQFLRGNLSEKICVASNEADWNKDIGALWANYTDYLGRYETAKENSYQALKRYNIEFQKCYEEHPDVTLFNFLQSNMTNILNPLLAAATPNCSNYENMRN